MVCGHVLCLNEGTPGSLSHLEVEALEERWRQGIQERRDAYEAVYRRILRSGMEQTVFRRVEPKTAALAMLGAVNWTVKWFRPDGGRSVREVGREFAEQMVRGVLAPGIDFRLPTEEPPMFAESEGNGAE